MNLIFLSGKYINLDNVTKIETAEKLLTIDYINGDRDHLRVGSQEAAAFHHYLSREAVNIEDNYQRWFEREERHAKIKKWEKQFFDFAEAKAIPSNIEYDADGRNVRCQRDEYMYWLESDQDVDKWKEANEETWAEFSALLAEHWSLRNLPF